MLQGFHVVFYEDGETQEVYKTTVDGDDRWWQDKNGKFHVLTKAINEDDAQGWAYAYLLDHSEKFRKNKKGGNW